jgi:hypothetical protein
MFYGTDNILWAFPHLVWMWGIFCRIMSTPQNIVMDLNNGMVLEIRLWY